MKLSEKKTAARLFAEIVAVLLAVNQATVPVTEAPTERAKIAAAGIIIFDFFICNIPFINQKRIEKYIKFISIFAW